MKKLLWVLVCVVALCSADADPVRTQNVPRLEEHKTQQAMLAGATVAQIKTLLSDATVDGVTSWAEWRVYEKKKNKLLRAMLRELLSE